LAEAARVLAAAKRPLVIAGGGVLRSNAMDELVAFAELVGAPIAPTQAGKGSVRHDHPLSVLAVGPTGTSVGNHIAATADVIVGVGTRYSDFVTASETAFGSATTFININLCHFDVGKQRALKLWGDAKATLAGLHRELTGSGFAPRGRRSSSAGSSYAASGAYFSEVQREREQWFIERARWIERDGSPMRQTAALGVLNEILGDDATIISAAGTLPGDLQKLWLDTHPLGYLCEYGYSTMGFEIAAGLGLQLAMPQRRIVVLVGDMSFLMMPGELVTAAELELPLTIVVFDNRGGQSIRHLQRRSGLGDYGMEYRKADGSGIDLDFAAIAEGMGCQGLTANDPAAVRDAMETAARSRRRPTVIHVKVDKEDLIGGYDSWWDVPQPEFDRDGRPRPEHSEYLRNKRRQMIR
jgi:3D-(3,5/4)-trihydroxycyclohexane-1,2-dione acylhydrolase (decyclizing)